MTINDKELNPTTTKNECNTFHIFNGCFKEGSYGANYYKKYYKGQYFEQEYLALVNNPEIDLYHPDNQKLLLAFHNKYKDAFFDDYCVTSITEDLAVSFTEYILSKHPTDVSKIKNKKILLYGEDAKMSKLRTDILANIVKAKKKYGNF